MNIEINAGSCSIILNSINTEYLVNHHNCKFWNIKFFSLLHLRGILDNCILSVQVEHIQLPPLPVQNHGAGSPHGGTQLRQKLLCTYFLRHIRIRIITFTFRIHFLSGPMSCKRWFLESATSMLPRSSTASPAGSQNCPGPVPDPPNTFKIHVIFM